MSLSNQDRAATEVKKEGKQSNPRKATVTNHLQSPPSASSHVEAHPRDKHIIGSISASSINNNHRQGLPF